MRPPSRRCSGVLWTSGVTVLILAFNTGYHITQQEQQRRTPRVWRQTSNVRLRALSKAAPPPKSTTTTTTPAATAAPATAADDCAGRPHTELWGAVIENGDGNPQPDAAACCRACRAYEPILDVAGDLDDLKHITEPDFEELVKGMPKLKARRLRASLVELGARLA